MYDNISNKIKGLANAIFIIEAILSFVLGIILLSNEELLYGFLTLAIGPLIAWISSWVLYGFGELIEKVSAIEQNTRNLDKSNISKYNDLVTGNDADTKLTDIFKGIN